MQVARAMLLRGFLAGGRIKPIIRTADNNHTVFAGSLIDDNADIR